MRAHERFTYSSAPERRDRIAYFVTEQGYCTVSELSQLFAVSEMTIRRDVSRLVLEGRLRGFHGGVGSLTPGELHGRDYSDRNQTMGDAKHAIAERAAQMVRPDSVIAIDAGTTGAQLASLLPRDSGIRVVTNSFSAVTSLAGRPDIEVDCLGGVLHPESLSFAGPSTLVAISNIQIDTLFLAASGLNDRGAFCATGFDAIIKRALIDVSDRVVLIADSSKFDISAMVKVCGWDDIETMVVDSGIGTSHKTLLGQNGVKVEIV